MPPEATSTPTLPHSCQCGARWGGANTAHCSAVGCHLVFSGITAFDAHRRNGRCISPQEAGLILVGGRPYECWGQESRWTAKDADE